MNTPHTPKHTDSDAQQPRAGETVPADEIGTRPRRADESTYGLANHQDGIQSGNLTGVGAGQRAKPIQDGNTPLSGPGDTHSNGMKGQR